MFGGLAQFIAGLYGFHARDTLVSVVNTMSALFPRPVPHEKD